MNSDAVGYYRYPTLHGETVVFVCEDDLWTVPAGGGIARRLTTSSAEIALPRFSPDGTQLAFVGRDEGHPEVYVMPAEGGRARRLTFLGSEVLYVCGWSSDGRDVLFTTDANAAFNRETAAYVVPVDGGAPRALELGHAISIAIRADGATLIGRNALDPARWKRYHGGTAGDLWVDPTGGGTFQRLLSLHGNPTWPMWLGDAVVFLSDHDGVANLYRCDANGDGLTALTHEAEYFGRFPSTDGARVVYGAGGEIVLYDPREGVRRIPILTPSSATQTARKFIEASEDLETFVPSPDGTTLGLVARGTPFVMPLWEEAVLPLPPQAGARRRLLAWMHDGRRIAFVDDVNGDERLVIAALVEDEPPRFITAGTDGRFVEVAASPVDDTIAFSNHRHELCVLRPGTSEATRIDHSPGARISDLAFSPEGTWLAYVWSPTPDTSIVRIANVAEGTTFDVTTPLRTDRNPAWDPDGKYLYFLSTRDFNPVYDALQFDLSFPQATRPFVATLRRDVPSPFIAKPAPLHNDRDDDKDKDKDKSDDDREAIAIDVEGITGRILGFPVPEGDYDQIAGARGRAVFSQFPVTGIRPTERSWDTDPHLGTLHAYDFEEQRLATLASDIEDFQLGADGRTLVYRSHEKLRAIDAGADLPEDEEEAKPPGEMTRRTGWLDLARASVLVEPRDEWRQMYVEAWRLQREQFWDASMSDVDWDAVRTRYEALIPRLRTRGELSDLIWEMQGELGTSHAYEIGGDYRVTPQYRRGFLGADVVWDPAQGGYRIERIYRGDSWDRELDSPLAEPGTDVRVGDTIMSIGGRALDAVHGIDEALVNLAARETTLTIARDGTRFRVLVKTLRSERMLRYRAWVEANRRYVHDRTDGAVGYLHIPDMGPWGFSEFHRGFLSEFDRDGLIVDVRYNRGGHVSPLLLEKLARKRVGYDVARHGPPTPYPPESVAGPIVALTNQFAGSDGDIFSHCFKLYKLGPLVGKRTWGGVIGINPYHRLVDGTVTTQPEFSFWFVDVGWGVENYGTDPDYDIDIAPHHARTGEDPQMEKALELVTAARLSANGRPTFQARPRLTLPYVAKRMN